MPTCPAPSHAAATATPRAIARRSPLAWLRAGLALRRQRLQLAELDAKQLRDIGVTPDQVRAEAKRPIWDVPAHWLR